MAFGRRKRRDDEKAIAEADAALPEEGGPAADDRTDVRAAGGPWDASEKDTAGDPAYLDLGSLRVRGRVGFDIQLPADDESGEQVGAVMLVAQDSAVEIRAFAASRSGGLWDEVRADILQEVQRHSGEARQVDGLFGPELHLRMPVEMPDGSPGVQPSRIVGVEGPRWFVRATFLGAVALEPRDDDLLMQGFRDLVVVRGNEARIPREPLLLTVPASDVLVVDEE